MHKRIATTAPLSSQYLATEYSAFEGPAHGTQSTGPFKEIQDKRPIIAVLWCMGDDLFWPDYAMSLPSSHQPIRYDILKGILPPTTNIQNIYLSGSELSVQSSAASPVKTYLLAVLQNDATDKKIAGTCFGAQALAKWALNKHVFCSYTPEEDLFREIEINGQKYMGHFNHEWFIQSDTKTDWTILAKKTFSITNAMAKVSRTECVDVFSAKLPHADILGLIPHPHVPPAEGESIAPIVAKFFEA